MADTTKPTEPYQVKLDTFIAIVPPVGGGQVRSTGKGSKTLKAPYKLEALEALEGVVTNPDFQKLTGYTQESLLKKWLTDRTTTCNEFCSKAGTAMGFVAKGKFDGVGRFDVADYLTRMGRGHCWVPAETGSTPVYGDIFRIYEKSHDQNGVSRNHMGVSLGVDGDKWMTVESGQGGPSSGYDAVERKQRVWPTPGVTGWVNMKALISADDKLPHWLGGWWEVKQEVFETWYYFFEAGGKVSYTPYKPTILSQPPAMASMIGNVTMKGMFGIEISWQSGDVDEAFTLGQQDSVKRKFTMTGKLVDSAKKISAERMMITGLL